MMSLCLVNRKPSDAVAAETLDRSSQFAQMKLYPEDPPAAPVIHALFRFSDWRWVNLLDVPQAKVPDLNR
jgi:hypothetical protein